MKPKLVRDKIPQVIEISGKKCRWHFAGPRELKKRLCDKMLEELDEFIKNPCIEEAADMYEVLAALVFAWEFEFGDVLDCAQSKRKERGGFLIGIVLDEVKDEA